MPKVALPALLTEAEAEEYLGVKATYPGILRTTMAVFTFQPKWKEELVCTGPCGSFVLDLTMGRLVAYLPTEASWANEAPWWAKRLWPVLHDELQEWCRANGAGFVVDPGAPVY